jgi:DNA-binding MarR family transcriptional regulator
MNTSSAIPVLRKWEEYLQTGASASLADFARWILENEKNPVVTRMPAPSNPGIASGETDRAKRVSMLVNRLHRMLVLFNKPIIRKLGLSKDHELAVLVQVFLSDKLNKKELANQALLEVSTTVEITKRLSARGLIKEQVDKTDRRSARISITEKGRKMLTGSSHLFSMYLKEMLNSLSIIEQQHLIELLEKLNSDNAERLQQFQQDLTGD